MNKTKKIAYMGIYLSIALICSYIEALIPINFGIPGVKLGLANSVTVLLLYVLSPQEAFLISIFRIVLCGFMFGNGFSILYSLAGGVLSFLIMLAGYKLIHLKPISVSMAGGIFHNIGQLIVACFIVNNLSVMYYFPVLLIAGAITGLLIGIIVTELIIRIPKSKFRG